MISIPVPVAQADYSGVSKSLCSAAPKTPRHLQPMKPIKTTSILMACLLLALGGRGQNLILNGDFETGNTNFSNDYTYSPDNMMPADTYCVTTQPSRVHGAWASFGDHTTGAGLMLVANGDWELTNVVWATNSQRFAAGDLPLLCLGGERLSGQPWALLILRQRFTTRKRGGTAQRNGCMVELFGCLGRGDFVQRFAGDSHVIDRIRGQRLRSRRLVVPAPDREPTSAPFDPYNHGGAQPSSCAGPPSSTSFIRCNGPTRSIPTSGSAWGQLRSATGPPIQSLTRLGSTPSGSIRVIPVD